MVLFSITIPPPSTKDFLPPCYLGTSVCNELPEPVALFLSHLFSNPFQAFSHFTFEQSGHRLIVVDIQGVGNLWTDPQIHTYNGKSYGDGNLGIRGMALFFHTHRCNPLCQALDLDPFDLCPGEQQASGMLPRPTNPVPSSPPISQTAVPNGEEQERLLNNGHSNDGSIGSFDVSNTFSF